MLHQIGRSKSFLKMVLKNGKDGFKKVGYLDDVALVLDQDIFDQNVEINLVGLGK